MKMSSAPVSEIPSVPDDYSYANSVDYNMKFTADISKHMQMPDRLAAVDGFRRMNFRADPSSESFVNESPAFAMTMPEKIILGNLFLLCSFVCMQCGVSFIADYTLLLVVVVVLKVRYLCTV